MDLSAAPASQEPGLVAVGTPRDGRGAKTMETVMDKTTPRSAKPATKAMGTTRRRRQRPRTKKQIALSLLERSKGASLAEMQKAMGWQAHSVRGFLAGTVRKMPGVILVSDKAKNGPRRYHVEAAGE